LNGTDANLLQRLVIELPPVESFHASLIVQHSLKVKILMHSLVT